MTYWILPSNDEVFRLSDFLKVSKLVDWRQHNNFEVGDVVFIYNSRPLHCITHKMVVERVNVPSSEYLNDRKFWTDIKECEIGLIQNRYVRLRLIAFAPNKSKLDLDTLRKKGLKGNLQKAIRVTDSKLLYYIKKQIQPETDEKIARICWNSNSWERPSGPEGKATTESYEAINGFGHEEWLLDRRKVSSDGYHYAFLEPLRKSHFDGFKDIHLYTFTPEGKKQYIGCIRDAKYVDEVEADEMWEFYKECGWAQSMVNELNDCSVHFKGEFKEHFNVKFKFDNYVDYSNEKLYLRKDDSNTANTHYVFLNKREPFLFETLVETFDDSDSTELLDPNNKIHEGAKTRVSVNRYERNSAARKKCLEVNGYSCKVCGMNFEKIYGSIGKDFIHVHHIIPIASIGKDYVIKPETDLVPVCPNCHAMLHRGKEGEVLSVEELKSIMMSD